MEPFPIACRHGCEDAVPKALRINSIERYHFAERHASRWLIPAGPRVERRIQSRFPADAFDRHQNFAQAFVFMFKLDANHRPALFPTHPVRPFSEFASA